MAEAPFMFHEYEQQLAQLYLNYEQAVFANPCDREQVRVTFETWRVPRLVSHLWRWPSLSQAKRQAAHLRRN